MYIDTDQTVCSITFPLTAEDLGLTRLVREAGTDFTCNIPQHSSGRPIFGLMHPDLPCDHLHREMWPFSTCNKNIYITLQYVRTCIDA